MADDSDAVSVVVTAADGERRELAVERGRPLRDALLAPGPCPSTAAAERLKRRLNGFR